jgi:hypothetical protein
METARVYPGSWYRSLVCRTPNKRSKMAKSKHSLLIRILVAYIIIISITSDFCMSRNEEDKKTLKPPRVLGMYPPVLTSEKELDLHNGHLVSIFGKTNEGPIGQILGVHVSREPSHQGEVCYASGILVKWVPEKAEGNTSPGQESEFNSCFTAT